jgi:hypothetical protein
MNAGHSKHLKFQFIKKTPENSVNLVQDDRANQHSLLSSLVDGKQETRQSSVHSPARGFNSQIKN